MRSVIRRAAAAALVLAAAPAFAQSGAVSPRDERMEDQPDLPGRAQTFGLCAACHNYRLVSSQGLTRDKWDETLTWMTQRHNMPALEGEDREVILGYLAKAHPPKAPSRAGGFRNPFAPQ